MSDSPASAFALGSMAGSLSGAREMEAAVALTTALRRRFQQPQVQVDVGALLEHLEEREVYIEGLEAEIAELRRKAALVEANRDQIHKWALWAEQKLKSVGAL